jgi:hypothetical protein
MKEGKEIMLFNWLLWCIKLKGIVPFQCGIVSHRELTEAEKDYVKDIKIPRELLNMAMEKKNKCLKK